jgi:hypothetical protein
LTTPADPSSPPSSPPCSKYEVNLSTRPDKSVGSDEIWTKAEEALQEALGAKGWGYDVDVGGGAFYGPKIDIKVQDAIGRKWQCSTIQLDFNLPERCGRGCAMCEVLVGVALDVCGAHGDVARAVCGIAVVRTAAGRCTSSPPSLPALARLRASLALPSMPVALLHLCPPGTPPLRFDMVYVDENAAKQRPIMIHRAIFGSLERFFGILIENYAGAFPLWLAPTQVREGAPAGVQ